MRKWTGRCQRCSTKTNCYIMSWYSAALICMDCSDKEQQREDIQDVKDADTLDHLRKHGFPTEQFEKQIADRKRKE